MDYATLGSLITSVGFPIVACVGMFVYLTKVMDKRDDKIDKTLNKMTEVVNENNRIIAIFSEKVDLLFLEREERSYDLRRIRRENHRSVTDSGLSTRDYSSDT